jgi:hypothetical protein
VGGLLGGQPLGSECLIWHQSSDISSRRRSFFIDIGEQPGFDRGSCPLSLRIILCETASLEDYGAQFGGAVAARVVEVHERKTGTGHGILQERNGRRRR